MVTSKQEQFLDQIVADLKADPTVSTDSFSDFQLKSFVKDGIAQYANELCDTKELLDTTSIVIKLAQIQLSTR